MNKFAIALISVLAASPVAAGDMTPAVSGGHLYTSADNPVPTVKEQIAASDAHARRTYSQIIADGGCNADFNTFEYASHCNAKAFGNPVGSLGGD